MSVLITGAAGFIGSALTRALVGAGESVVALDKLTYAGSRDNLAPAAASPLLRFVHGDINDAALLPRLFAEAAPSVVYHLAAESHVDRSIDRPADFVVTNVNGTVALLAAATEYWRGLPAAARGGFRFLQVSTDEVYGELGPVGCFDEASAYRPNSPYAASKAAADHMARAWHRTYGLPVLITNCSNNYGPYQFPEKLVPLMILNAVAGKPLPVYGRGEQVRDWLHVDDHAAALRLVAAAGTPGETYLIGARNERRNIDLVHALCRALDERHPAGRPHERLISFVADRPGHDARYAIDPMKLERDLGWRAAVPFERGLGDTVAWYLANGDWCRRMAARYDGGRLGLGERAP
ncbi:MAG TPA: dTDP-glucose 4,6-dehydratase [Candidatus Sulfotelmatobacter sp.]|nr:dTDP-glucose 4,6-dehydratase [Candidatus Sulfotelmatobacter sp.]